MGKAPAALFCLWLALCACDDIPDHVNERSPMPVVVPPKLSPITLSTPRVQQETTLRIDTRMPRRVNSTQVDMHRQSEGVVDILWVLDDSGSMKNQRATLVSNFDRFLDELLNLGVDFHIGVTSTNAADNGRLRGTFPIIDRQTSNPKSVFLQNTTFPDSRARWEQGLRMAEFAVTDNSGANAGFLRPNAALAIIVVSDEDDSSIGQPDYYARVFRSAKGQGNERLVTFSSIAGPTPDGCFPPGEETFFGGLAEAAFRYSTVAQKTGGLTGSICSTTFESTLSQIVAGLNTLRRVFPLTLQPIPDTIVVLADGVVIPNDATSGWQYLAQTQSIAFLGSYLPAPGVPIRIEYSF